ncbi:MAG TPA: Ig-like domain-containing protein [Terriglobales bacterium]|nr:Ig-like domain-containing protein [Terriglobales bacterium]
MALASAGLLTSLSCGHDQQLTSITIQPAAETFGAANIPVSADAGLTVQLRALGSFIHPPVTKDITSQVTWASNSPGIATVDANGLLTASGIDCGDSLISATVQTNHSLGNINSSGAIVTGYMTATVVCFTGMSAAQPGLTVKFSGTGAGTVTSLPLGLSCAGTCSASLPRSGPIQLTARPNSPSFGGWSGCDSVSASGLVCTVHDAASERTVTASFH